MSLLFREYLILWFIKKLCAFLYHVATQILPEVLHLRLSTGGVKHPLHSAVIPQ